MRQNGTLEPVESTPASPYLLPEEVAALLRYHPETVRELIRAKRITAFKSGRKWLVHRTEVDRWLGKPNTATAASLN